MIFGEEPLLPNLCKDRAHKNDLASSFADRWFSSSNFFVLKIRGSLYNNSHSVNLYSSRIFGYDWFSVWSHEKCRGVILLNWASNSLGNIVPIVEGQPSPAAWHSYPQRRPAGHLNLGMIIILILYMYVLENIILVHLSLPVLAGKIILLALNKAICWEPLFLI